MEFIFFVIAALLIASAIGVIAFKNPIYSALCLIGNLVLVAALYAQLHAHFLAVVQLVVYAGAIMVLVLFVLMLLNLKLEDHKQPSTMLTVGAVVVGVLFLCALVPPLQRAFENGIASSSTLNSVSDGSVYNMGIELFTKNLFSFEAASILIMIALVGAVMLSKRQPAGGRKV